MRKLITVQRASQLILVLLGGLIVFHLLVIAGIIPADWVWGNKFETSSILPLELISIVVTLAFGLFTLIKMRYLKNHENSIVVNIGLWIAAFVLLLSSIANLLSEVPVEHFVFAPTALLVSLLTIRLAIEK